VVTSASFSGDDDSCQQHFEMSSPPEPGESDCFRICNLRVPLEKKLGLLSRADIWLSPEGRLASNLTADRSKVLAVFGSTAHEDLPRSRNFHERDDTTLTRWIKLALKQDILWSNSQTRVLHHLPFTLLSDIVRSTSAPLLTYVALLTKQFI